MSRLRSRIAIWITAARLRAAVVTLLLGSALLLTAGCGTSEVACTYEEKSEWSCSSSGKRTDDWKRECKYQGSRDECERWTTGGKSCDAYGHENCCVTSSYRSIEIENDGWCFWDPDKDS